MTYKNFAINLAKQAGKIMRKNFALGMKKKIKGDGSPVTVTDLAINSLVIKQVKKYFPEHAVMGEEESYERVNAQDVWLCDPVDGTIPFSKGMPTFMFLLGLVHKGDPILGVAYDPIMDRMFFAEKSKGAFLNGKKIHVSKQSVLKGSYISQPGAWPSQHYPMPGLVEELAFKYASQPFGVHSIGYNACLLAAGQIDGAIFAHHTAHDVAATKIIIEEAGGKVTDIYGHEQRYDRPITGCVMSNGIMHKQLLSLVKQHLKKKV